jgi:ubiquinone/menaquinone biosynthesis C-methylase UbiE
MLDEIVRQVRTDPQYAELVRDSYLGEDLYEAAARFSNSAEFAEVLYFSQRKPEHSTVLDLGAGNGIASWAFAAHSFRHIYALEPNCSTEVGSGAIARLCAGLPVQPIKAYAEQIPLDSETVDIVYARQVLHHTVDLKAALRECDRVLKKGGVLLATREHVCDDRRQLEEFLSSHPIHQLEGGENAFPLDSYLGAIQAANLQILRVLGPWDSVINAFPAVRTTHELSRYHRIALERRLGIAGTLLSFIPPVKALAWARIKRPKPGRPYSFIATKP